MPVSEQQSGENQNDMMKPMDVDSEGKGPQRQNMDQLFEEDRAFINDGRALFKYRDTRRCCEMKPGVGLLNGYSCACQQCCCCECRCNDSTACCTCKSEEKTPCCDRDTNCACQDCSREDTCCVCCISDEKTGCCKCCNISRFCTMSYTPGPGRQLMDPSAKGMHFIPPSDYKCKCACCCCSSGARIEGCKQCCQMKCENSFLCIRRQSSTSMFQCDKQHRNICKCVTSHRCCPSDPGCCRGVSNQSCLFGLCECEGWNQCEKPGSCLACKNYCGCLHIQCNLPCNPNHTPIEVGCFGIMCRKAPSSEPGN